MLKVNNLTKVFRTEEIETTALDGVMIQSFFARVMPV